MKDPKKNMALANLSIYYTWKNMKSEYRNNKFKISAPTWNDAWWFLFNFWHSRLLSIYYQSTLNLTENPPVQIYMSRTKNRIVFKITTGYKLEILTPETMKLLGSTNEDVDKDKNGKNVPKIESVEVVSVDCNLVKNDYQHTQKVLFTFIPNKQFGQLTNISPHSLTIMKTVNIKLFSVEVWFTDQISKALEIEDNVNLTLIIG